MATSSDRIPVELFQILKDDAVESAVLNMQYAGSRHPIDQWSPTFLALGTSFMKDSFSMDQGGWDGFEMIQAHYIYCVLTSFIIML